MTADEIIAKANPCDCGHNGNVHYKSINGWHALICSYCGDSVCMINIDDLLGAWNDDNPLPEPKPIDQAWQQVTELAQASKAGEAQPSAIDTALRAHVKKTADELPDVHDEVLVWANGYWVMAWRDVDGDWENYTDYTSASEVKYWLPLPTFDPEN